MSASKIIEIQSLTKRYGRARGVEDLSFDIARGEIFGYLGPNGSGKTTTIRCLMGLLRPTGGQCRILGQKILPGRATQHTRIGYLPGDPTWDGIIDIADVLFLINYLYRSGEAPDPPEAGDVTCDGTVNVDDVIFLINYLYRGGPAPPDEC